MNSRRPLSGFTLLETLVTVAIFALLFAVLMGGWYQALKAQSRLADTAELLQRQQQISAMLRQLMGELTSPRRKESGVLFAGTRRGFTGESTASQAPGLGSAPVPVSLLVEGSNADLLLRIEHPSIGPERYPWRFAAAEFRYLDASGRPFDTWPPEPATTDQRGVSLATVPPLPTLIQFTSQLQGQVRATTILVAPHAPRWPIEEPAAMFEMKLE